MVDFKVVLSDPKTGLAYKIDAAGAAAGALLGKKIGTEVDGAPFGMNGYKIMITGGSDKTGIQHAQTFRATSEEVFFFRTDLDSARPTTAREEEKLSAEMRSQLTSFRSMQKSLFTVKNR